ncbi:uncharacterized protein LOC131616375 [Vicia villosa]|uniref:uncharacterized protein LOC131616375 n=1 Tax=Vicia villosa TaxID=3911 RepID=UPI00273B5AD6|nr:uncharacterized protein LOC131616375 [Vicia villosa]
MGLKVDPKFLNMMGGFIPMEMVVKGAFELITDESKAGDCLWITNRLGMEYWPTPSEEAKYTIRSTRLRRRTEYKAPSIKLPESFEKIVVHTLTHNFRNATGLARAPLRLPIKSNYVLVKIIYAGVNASDVNFSSGRYYGGNNNDTAARLPFDAGFEVAVDTKKFIGLHSVADAVEYLHSGKSVEKVVVSVDPTFVNHVAKL